MIAMGYLIPIFIEKFKYEGVIEQVETLCHNIAKREMEIYSTENRYIEVTRRGQSLLRGKLQIRDIDLKDYNYMVTTIDRGFKIVAEPKIESLRRRDVPVKIYTYIHTQNGGDDVKEWRTF